MKRNLGLCEAVVGIDPKSRQPHLLKCNRPATTLYRPPGARHRARVCDECKERMREQYEKEARS